MAVGIVAVIAAVLLGFAWFMAGAFGVADDYPLVPAGCVLFLLGGLVAIGRGLRRR